MYYLNYKISYHKSMMNYNNIKIIRGHEETPVSVDQCFMISELIKNNETPITKTMEVGFAFGRSALAIMDATIDRPHIAIDPYQNNGFKNYGLYNLENNNISMDRFTLVERLSQFYLPEYASNNPNTIGFVFIDGEHTFDNIFIDFYYIDMILYVGGIVVFDDIWLKAVQQIKSFILKNRNNYEEIPVDIKYNMFVFKKLKEYEIQKPTDYQIF